MRGIGRVTWWMKWTDTPRHQTGPLEAARPPAVRCNATVRPHEGKTRWPEAMLSDGIRLGLMLLGEYLVGGADSYHQHRPFLAP